MADITLESLVYFNTYKYFLTCDFFVVTTTVSVPFPEDIISRYMTTRRACKVYLLISMPILMLMHPLCLLKVTSHDTSVKVKAITHKMPFFVVWVRI